MDNALALKGQLKNSKRQVNVVHDTFCEIREKIEKRPERAN